MQIIITLNAGFCFGVERATKIAFDASKELDGDIYTLIRTLEANPLVLKINFPEPRQMNGLTARVGGTPTRLTVRAYQETANGDSEHVEFIDWAGDWPEPREMSIDFDSQVPIDYLEIEVENSRDQEPAHVHLWEVWLR